jgi:beta-lysine N6-acetyltransferase
MNLAPEDYPDILPRLDHLARKNDYTKIFAKVPEKQADVFKKAGYVTEAYIPGFFRGRQDVQFMAFYLDANRQKPANQSLLNRVLAVAGSKAKTCPKATCSKKYRVLRMSEADADDMAKLFSHVFDSYPFPIFNADYLRKNMLSNVIYFGVRREDELVGLASADMDMQSLAAEMSDFATLPRYRGMGLAGILLDQMSKKTEAMGIITLFTIARAVSFGMNITFARAGFKYAGTLINNTHIAGRMENMNLWYKHILKPVC